MNAIKSLTVELIPTASKMDINAASSAPITVIGRAAWALDQLVTAGPKGCTPIDNPAPRWSHYVFLLRRAGLPVLTHHESHGGPFAGHHARYELTSHVRVLREVRA